MKHFNIPSKFILLTVLILASCRDETFSNLFGSDDKIRFDVTVTSGSWQSRSGSCDDAAPDSTGSGPRYVGVFPLEGTEPGDSLFLHVTIEDGIDPDFAGNDGDECDGPASRGTQVTQDEFYESFALMAGTFRGDSFDPATFRTEYIPLEEITEASGWKSSYLFPKTGEKFRFFAYAPYGPKSQWPDADNKRGLYVTDSISTVTGTPVVKYNQAYGSYDADILFAVSDPVDPVNNPVESVGMRFYHALTGLKAKTAADFDRGKLTEFHFYNFHTEGTHALGSDSWELTDKLSNIGATYNNNTTTGNNIVFLVGNSSIAWHVLPQTLPDNAYIQLNYIPLGLSKAISLKAKIGGTEWPMGKTVTYTVSSSSVKREFRKGEVSMNIIPGGGVPYIDRHRSEISHGNIYEAIGYKVTYIDQSGNTCNRPSWISDRIYETDKHLFNISPMNYTATEMYADFSSASVKGTDTDPWNLSNTGGGSEIVNTANCYIINNPGHYRLPLVYGNAIRNGADNSGAYTSSRTDRDILPQFVDYKDLPISSPYVYDSGTPADAVLLWQDSQNLVTGVSLDDTKQWIEFAVDGSTIRPGNALVAVRDTEGKIMWSWHLWVTSYDPYDNSSADNGCIRLGELEAMKTYLGFVGKRYVFTGEERSCIAKITQNGTNETRTVSFTQSPTKEIHGFFPVYQWGRKDPLRGKSTSPFGNTLSLTWTPQMKMTDMPQYGEYLYASKKQDGLTIGMSIQEPNTEFNLKSAYGYWYAYEGDNTAKRSNTNLWNNGNTYYKQMIKTVYDPSPVGFVVPDKHYLTFLIDIVKTKIPEQTNPFSFRFYTSADATEIMELPVQNDGIDGYWTSSYKSTSNNSGYKGDYSGYTQEREYNYKKVLANHIIFSGIVMSNSDKLPVLPVKEK